MCDFSSDLERYVQLQNSQILAQQQMSMQHQFNQLAQGQGHLLPRGPQYLPNNQYLQKGNNNLTGNGARLQGRKTKEIETDSDSDSDNDINRIDSSGSENYETDDEHDFNYGVGNKGKTGKMQNIFGMEYDDESDEKYGSVPIQEQDKSQAKPATSAPKSGLAALKELSDNTIAKVKKLVEERDKMQAKERARMQARNEELKKIMANMMVEKSLQTPPSNKSNETKETEKKQEIKEREEKHEIKEREEKHENKILVLIYLKERPQQNKMNN
jgi:hypothetical protein